MPTIKVTLKEIAVDLNVPFPYSQSITASEAREMALQAIRSGIYHETVMTSCENHDMRERLSQDVPPTEFYVSDESRMGDEIRFNVEILDDGFDAIEKQIAEATQGELWLSAEFEELGHDPTAVTFWQKLDKKDGEARISVMTKKLYDLWEEAKSGKKEDGAG